MEQPPINYVEITERAQMFIKEKKFEKPLLIIFLGEQLKLRGGAGDPMGFHSIPSYNYLACLFEGKDINEPSEGFVKVDSTIDVPIYVMKPILEVMIKQRGRLKIDVAGFWKTKHLIIKPIYHMQ
jgi:hypothetical protein